MSKKPAKVSNLLRAISVSAVFLNRFGKLTEIPQEMFKLLGVFMIRVGTLYDLSKLANISVCVLDLKTAKTSCIDYSLVYTK